MNHRKLSDGRILLKALPGEDLVAGVTAFLNAHKIYAGSLTGIGAALDVELGHFDSKTRQYHKVAFPGPVEIVALTGNVSRVEDGTAFVHMHAVISKPDMTAAGGHVFRAIIEPTCEIYLDCAEGAVERRMDETKGLKLLAI